MYGTVQAALQWFKKLVQCLLNMGMTQSKVDPCVFYLKRDNKLILLVGTHVDDCAIAGKPSDILAFKKEIKDYFTIKELGQLNKHLGVWYEWGSDKDGRYLESNMEDFVQGMFEDFKDLFGRLPKIASTPSVPGSSLRKNTDGEIVLHSEYRST